MRNSERVGNRRRAAKIIAAYFVAGFGYIAVTNLPISIRCVFKWITGLPCPGCGLARAFMLARRFQFVEAAMMNILFWPLAIGASIYFVCALVELLFNKPAIKKFDSVLAKKWIIALAIVLTAASWIYNIVCGH